MGDLIELEGSSSGADFEYRMAGKSMPSTPPRSLRASRSKSMRGKGKEREMVADPEAAPAHKLTHSRSTPSLRLTIPSPPDARVLRLRTLAVKLRMLFTDDARTLSNLLVNDVPEEDGFVDVRGKPPAGEEGEKLVHVFIDQYVATLYIPSYNTQILTIQLKYPDRLLKPFATLSCASSSAS